MTLQVEIQDLRRMLKEKCDEIISDKKLAYEFFLRICEIEEDDRFTMVEELLEEQDAVEPKVSCTEQRCGNCNKVIEMDGWKVCPWCGKMIDWERWWKKNGTRNQDT